MKKPLMIGSLIAAALVAGGEASAGPWEDGVAAYNRGDYVPAIQIFRPLARAGNAKAQAVLGTMYRRGQGVAKSSAQAFMWLSLAAARGDRAAKTQLKTVSDAMSPDELSRAREMMQACAASDYRNCEY